MSSDSGEEGEIPAVFPKPQTLRPGPRELAEKFGEGEGPCSVRWRW